MVLQLANNGDLREYLKINFSKLEWTDKLRMAREISDGLEFLHKNDIIHRDLVTLQNILVHDRNLLIADFGLSKDETSKPSSDSFHGVQAYNDPQCFIGPQCLENVSYKRSKKSDIYSFGGGREIPIEGTPDSYIQIYERCWNYDPNQRPELEEIQESLLNLLRKENFGTNKFDKFISDTTPKISNSEISLSTNSNNDYKKILEQSQQSLKFIDDLFMEYFLNACGNYNIDHVTVYVDLAGLIVSNQDPITSASTVILKASGELFVSELFVGELYCR
ncbi:kinase-like domain-containing protein [Gigaspora rosea]|uniref:Kinase-like domain-containing protein n=1 Tax=Gigaspora rosea TaxID=44941 RepID=A0A397U8V9_9GLOM|nr:kinase-like domain-containing protein [Gigaspora rosea]